MGGIRVLAYPVQEAMQTLTCMRHTECSRFERAIHKLVIVQYTSRTARSDELVSLFRSPRRPLVHPLIHTLVIAANYRRWMINGVGRRPASCRCCHRVRRLGVGRQDAGVSVLGTPEHYTLSRHSVGTPMPSVLCGLGTQCPSTRPVSRLSWHWGAQCQPVPSTQPALRCPVPRRYGHWKSN